MGQLTKAASKQKSSAVSHYTTQLNTSSSNQTSSNSTVESTMKKMRVVARAMLKEIDANAFNTKLESLCEHLKEPGVMATLLSDIREKEYSSQQVNKFYAALLVLMAPLKHENFVAKNVDDAGLGELFSDDSVLLSLLDHGEQLPVQDSAHQYDILAECWHALYQLLKCDYDMERGSQEHWRFGVNMRLAVPATGFHMVLKRVLVIARSFHDLSPDLYVSFQLVVEQGCELLFEMFDALTLEETIGYLDVTKVEELVELFMLVTEVRQNDHDNLKRGELAHRSEDTICHLLNLIMDAYSTSKEIVKCIVDSDLCESLIALLTLEADPITDLKVVVRIVKLVWRVVEAVEPAVQGEVSHVMDLVPIGVLLRLKKKHSSNMSARGKKLTKLLKKAVEVMKKWAN
eukprot:gene24669-31038_t